MLEQLPEVLATVTDLFHVDLVHRAVLLVDRILNLATNAFPIRLWADVLFFFLLVAVVVLLNLFGKDVQVKLVKHISYLLLRLSSDPLSCPLQLILELTIIA